jgi:putative Holliday junction resolvase
MKYLGIDYGTKNIGIATSDDDGRMAFPKSVLDNDNKILENLEKLIKENKINKIVIGDSKNYKMEDNAIMEDVYDLKKILETTMEIDVDLHSEVLTSMQAEKMMGEKNEMIDASAAAIMLQSYLDLQNNKK